MKTSSMLLPATLAAYVQGQSAPGYPLRVQANLEVVFQPETPVTPPGILLPRPSVLEAPSIYLPAGASINQPYVLLMIDQDVLQMGTRMELLHWFQPNLVATSDNANLSFDPTVAGASTAVGATYLTPTPPGGDIPHHYTLTLFSQPQDWAVPSQFATVNPPANSSARIGFNLTDFVSASGLQPIASNYFRVLNGTAAETSSYATMDGTAVISTSTMAGASSTMPASVSASSTEMPSAASSSVAIATPTGLAVTVHSPGKELLAGLAMGVAGAALWMM